MDTSAILSAADRLDVLETLSRYAWSYDLPDLELMASVFSEDATFAIHLEGTEGWGPFVGGAAIVEWLGGIMKTQTDQRRHIVSNFRFREFAADRAVVDSYLTLAAAENGAVRLATTGWYRDELVRRAGVWRIRRKDLYLDAPF